MNAEKEQPSDLWEGHIHGSWTDPRLRCDELKAAVQLLPKQIRGCPAVLAPPTGCLANLPLGLRDDLQPQPQSSVLELSE